MEIDQQGQLANEKQEEKTSCKKQKITQIEQPEFFVDKVKSTTPLQHTNHKAQSSNLTNTSTSNATEGSKEADGKMSFIREISFHEKRPLIGNEWQNMGTYHSVRKKEAFLGQQGNKPKKNCDQVQHPESPVVASMSARVSRRNKRIDSHKTTKHIFGVHQRKDSGKYTTEIRNPISKKRIWLGTFATAEEASRAYQSKKLEFQKLVNAKQDGNSEKLVNVKQGHENVNCEHKSAGRSPEIDVPFSNSSNGGTDQRIDSHEMDTAEEALHAYQSKKFDLQSSKKVELQNDMPTDSSAGEKQEGQDDDKDLWMGEWVQLPEKLVKAKQQCTNKETHSKQDGKSEKLVKAKQQCTNKQTHSKQDGKSEKLVKAKQQCTNKQTHSKQDGKSEKLVKAKQQCTNKETHSKQDGKSEKLVKAKQQCTNKETHSKIDSHEIGTTEEDFHAYQSKKFDLQSSKKVELQSYMPTDSSSGKKQEGQEDDEDLWMGEWVQLPGNRAVKFSLKLGLPIIDNYGSLLGEFSTLDDLSIC
ncbi:hypothetical protein K7X08_013313 [Anisodus acutangulus]|uniref:AP2/ERF domain-containing protein n=1 Tax=Anisodus acutangulus TaxID=402998 RepID=A0A9Q1RH92_9SOLA|nr:hypothetical protein K7X08_013313 [Anisodus acutangulus]